MAHFMEMLDPECLGAAWFTDENMQPTRKQLTIKAVCKKKPPGGGKERVFVSFVETAKGAFFANSQIKTLATKLQCADTTKWAGVRLTITCAEVKSPKGGTTMGMVLVGASRTKSKQSIPEPDAGDGPPPDDHEPGSDG